MNELKGYSYTRISSKKAIRKSIASELQEKVDMVKLEAQLDEIKKHGGIMYGIKKQGDIKGIVVIDVKKYDVSDFEFESEENVKLSLLDKAIFKTSEVIKKMDNKCYKNSKEYQNMIKTVNAFEMVDVYLTKELEKRDKLVMFDIIDDLKLQLGYSNRYVRAIIWGENVIADSNVGISPDSSKAMGLSVCVLFGTLIGAIVAICLKNLLVEPYAICLGLLFGNAFVKKYYKAGIVKGENVCL